MDKKKVRVANLAPGMKLAENIANSSGITLMPEGVRLTPMFIAKLSKWGIEEVEIQVDADEARSRVGSHITNPGIAAMPNASVEQREFVEAVSMEVAETFANVVDNPLMMQLRKIALKKRVADGPNGLLASFRSKAAGSGSEKR